MIVKFKKLTENAVAPKYAHYGTDMGADITCTSYEYDEVKDRFIYHTGLAFEVPKGYGMLIFPRSSNTKTESYLPNSVGVLDSSYRGELMFIYKNRTAGHIVPPYKEGERIGQVIIFPYPIIDYQEVDELSETDRGTSGFGSTGK